MKIYSIERHGVDHFFAIQEDAIKKAREFAADSYDPVEVEALEAKHWPLTKRTFADVLNGELWHGEPEAIYTAQPKLTGERPAPESLPGDQVLPGPVGAPTPGPVNQDDGERLHAESVEIIDPYAV